MAREDELADNIFHLKQDTTCSVSDSGTIDLIKTNETIGYTLMGKVKVSTAEYNLINNSDEPLYASVDLLYDDVKNQLTLK